MKQAVISAAESSRLGGDADGTNTFTLADEGRRDISGSEDVHAMGRRRQTANIWIEFQPGGVGSSAEGARQQARRL